MSYLPKKKKTKPKWPVTILIDDREKKGIWNLHEPRYFRYRTQRLGTGDYTIAGHTELVTIEKKSGLAEFITDISGRNRETFRNFLERLSVYPIKCIVIEDSLDNLEKVLKRIPKTLLDAQSVCYWLTMITIKYGIPILFVGKNPRIKALVLLNLFNRIMEQIYAK